MLLVQTTFEAASEPDSLAQARMVGLRALTGLNDMGMPDMGLDFFAEVAHDDEHAGYANPWTYRPAQLDAVKLRVYRAFPPRTRRPTPTIRSARRGASRRQGPPSCTPRSSTSQGIRAVDR